MVLLGDPGVGKTALSIRRKNETKNLPKKIPSVCKTWRKKTHIERTDKYANPGQKGYPVQITVHDWPADRPISKLKEIKADIYLLCFDIRNRVSLKNIKEKYLKELYEHQDDVFGFNPQDVSPKRGNNEIIPIVLLVGCKRDMRNARDKNFVVPKVSDDGLFASVFKKKTNQKQANNKKKKQNVKQEDEDDENIDWHQLPDEVFLLIFSYLDGDALGRMACVCKRWQKLTEDKSLWNKRAVLKVLDGINNVMNLRNSVTKTKWKSGYVECSAVTGEGVREVFDTAVKLVWRDCPIKRRVACSLF